MRALALIVDLLDVGGIFTLGALNRRSDVVLGHVLRLCILDRKSKLGIVFGVPATVLGRHGDGFGKFRKHLGHLVPAFFLRGATIFECSSHR